LVDPQIKRYRLPQVATPIDPQDIANKAYVDAAILAQFRRLTEAGEIDADGQFISTIAFDAVELLIVTVDSDGAVGADDLDNLTALTDIGFAENTILILQSTSNARDITIRNAQAGTGFFSLDGAVNFVLTDVDDRIILIANAAGGWQELSRSDNS